MFFGRYLSKVDVSLLKLALSCMWLLAGCSDDQQMPLGSLSATTASLYTKTVYIYLVSQEIIFNGIIEAVNESTVVALTSG